LSVANRRPVKRKSAAASSAYPGKIRIISGQWRGRKLPVLGQAGLRPTPDRVRETLFNWLAPVIDGARCVDLFAGTGALCLEALSRGAADVVMVESAPQVIEQLRRNIATLGAMGAEVIQADAAAFLQRAPQAFDIIFLDPPFASDLIARCGALIAEHGWIKPGGLIYVEAPATMQPLPLPAAWEIIKSKQAGQVGYHLLRAPAY
jgi:16S rRNA (guanine966-N2)-methyltransferase